MRKITNHSVNGIGREQSAIFCEDLPLTLSLPFSRINNRIDVEHPFADIDILVECNISLHNARGKRDVGKRFAEPRLGPQCSRDRPMSCRLRK